MKMTPTNEQDPFKMLVGCTLAGLMIVALTAVVITIIIAMVVN